MRVKFCHPQNRDCREKSREGGGGGGGGMTAPATPRGAHALPWQSGEPCRGRPDIFKSALVLCITFTLLAWGATQHALALNLGSPAIF